MKVLDGLRQQLILYPYPLGMISVQTLAQAKRWLDQESIPNLPYDICRAAGLLLRMNAAIAIRAYVDSGMADSGLNSEIVNALRAPSDGAWHNITPKLAKYLSDKEKPAIVGALQATLSHTLNIEPPIGTNERARLKAVWKQKKKDVSAHLGTLVTYRNKVIHGERLTRADHRHALSRLFALYAEHRFYRDYNLLVRHGGSWLDCDATLPRSLNLPDDPQAPWWNEGFAAALQDVSEDEPFIVSNAHPMDRLNLSPLLHFTGQEAGPIQMDELLFVNRGTKDAAEYIAYRHEGSLDARTLGNYESFRRFISSIPTPPLAREKRINFFGLYELHHERFVGREDVIAEIDRRLRETDKPYIELRAHAGMGKTAILAELYGLHGTREHNPWPINEQQPTEARPPTVDRWAFHFCMAREGRDDPVVALQSIISQLCDGAGLKRSNYISNELPVQREKLSDCLVAVRNQLNDDRRIFICIDALDEGIPSHGTKSVPAALPGQGDKEPDLPDGVVFLLSHRVDENGRSRADDLLDHIPGHWRERLKTANPLSGLTRDDVKHLLNNLQQQVGADRALPGPTHEAVWTAATKETSDGASPFYLRFLGDDVLSQEVDLTRPESVPPDLTTVFERSWMTLPSDHDYALHRMLATLAIMREHGDDEIMQYVINASRDDREPLPLDVIRDLRTAAGKLLVYDGDRYGLFHDKFREFLVGPQRDRVEEAVEAYRIVNG